MLSVLSVEIIVRNEIEFNNKRDVLFDHCREIRCDEFMNVSVALCTYNGVDYLELQLESILKQTRPPDEVIISDDCSDDGTVALAQDYAEQHPDTIQILKSETNLGVTKNFERAIEACEGDLIALADQDDYWHEDKLERQVDAYEQTGAELVCHDSYIVTDDNIKTNHATKTLWSSVRGGHEPLSATNPDLAMTELLKRNFVQGSTALLSSRFTEKILPIPECANHDYYVAVFAAILGGIYDMDARLMNYRQHSNQDVGVSRTIRERLSKEFSKELTDYEQSVCFWGDVLCKVEKMDCAIDVDYQKELNDDLKKRYQYSKHRKKMHDPSEKFPNQIISLYNNISGYVQYGHPVMSFMDLLKTIVEKE